MLYVDTTTAFFEIDTVYAPIRITQTLTQTQTMKLVTQAPATTQTHVTMVSTIHATADAKMNAQPWETAWQNASSTKLK